ncbi:MATE family efflux transporter [Dyadobacter sp. CY323]|uniref:MATE family efflux transporter n=1 Tax=Dyadobacter sp. CY323 TaxID=2907302 RepID=UPI001EFEF461|nr:MATE family efflux transporter [Dyadobacter sp. CY323]MCE6990170.1 polysaccharide biosynthesis C-terminal domain-containing protein [Dyadobacter sp. CY323]
MRIDNELGERPIRSLFFKYYTPALISILSSTLHQVINGVILGQQVGKEGLAAVGLYGPVVILFIALALPVMIGSGILIGKNIGAKKYDLVHNIFQFATTIALLFGGIIALSAPFLIKPVANFLAGVDNATLVKNISDYMFWQLIGMPFFFLGMFWGGFIRNDNAPNIPKNASLIAVSLNIILDLVLIIGFDMGVKGASLATALSSFTSVLYLFFYIRKGRNHLSFRNFRFTLKFTEWRELLNLGLPTFASELSFSCGLLIISHRVVPYGPLAVSAFGLINYVSFILIRFFTAAMIASLPIISFNIGAKLPLRVLAIFKFSLVFTLALGSIISLLGFLLPDLLIENLMKDATAEFKQIASSGIGLYFLLFLAAGPNYILSAYFQSIGKSTISTLINVLKGFVFIALLLMILPEHLHMGLNGVWISRSFAEILTFVSVGLYTIYKREIYYSSAI